MQIIESSKFPDTVLVSVIVPSYNRAETVGATIDSIIEQKCDFNFEIIVGDDCSTDAAREVLLQYQSRYPERIKLLFHEQNIGLGANWASCVKVAKGKYLCNCDNDDYWHNPDKLSIQFNYMEKHPEENVIITNHRNHNRDKGLITEELAWIDRSLPLQQAFFQGKQRFCNATIMYRTEFLKRYLNLDDFIKYQFTLQDWNTWIVLSAYTDFTILPVSTATFGIETESITRPATYGKVLDRFRKEKKCYQYVCGLFPESLIYDEQSYDTYIYSVLLNLARKKRDFKNARKYAKSMIGLGNKSFRIRMSQYYLGFYILHILKVIKKHFKNLIKGVC